MSLKPQTPKRDFYERDNLAGFCFRHCEALSNPTTVGVGNSEMEVVTLTDFRNESRNLTTSLASAYGTFTIAISRPETSDMITFFRNVWNSKTV